MTRVFVTAVLVAIAGLALPAQNGRGDDFGRADWCAESFRNTFGPGRSESYCEVREETLPGQRTIDVDAGANGGITVRGWDRGDVHVRVRISAYAPTAQEAREIVSSVMLTTSGGRIRADGPTGDRGRSWAASFEIQAPRDAQLALTARNGGIALGAFRGTAEMQTVNGGLAITGTSGDIRGRTQNGGIAVDLTGRSWDGRGLDVETSNGGVTINVPPDYSAELEFGTVNGGIRTDIPVTVTGRLDSRIRTTLGSGGALVRAVTTNGGVNIRRR